MTLEQLEEVLFFFYNDRDWYKYPEQLNAQFELKFKKPEIQAMVQKLVKDGYVIEESIPITTTDGKTGEIKDRTNKHGWYISWDGINLIQDLPKKYEGRPYQYLEHKKVVQTRWKKMETFPKRFWWLIALVTFGVGFFTDVFKEQLKSKSSQPSLKLELRTPASVDTMQNPKSPLLLSNGDSIK